MTVLVLVVVLALAAIKAKAPKKVELLYPRDGGRIVNGQAVFPCGCRFALGSQARQLCQAHEAIVSAETRA